MKKKSFILFKFFRLFVQYRVPRAAAALSYFLTLTFFPMFLCLYFLLGRGTDFANRVIFYLSPFFASETVETVSAFFGYVAKNNSPAMFFAGLFLFITSSSAAVRSIQFTIGDIQGRMRFKQLNNFLISFLISILFVGVLYVGIFVLMSGRSVISLISSYLPFIDISRSWSYIRYIILSVLLPVTLYSIYWLCRDRREKYSLWPGVIFSTLGTLIVCLIFSVFINASVRYPLVYGSLASIILLMMWIYFFAISMYSGAVVNILVRDIRNGRISPEGQA